MKRTVLSFTLCLGMSLLFFQCGIGEDEMAGKVVVNRARLEKLSTPGNPLPEFRAAANEDAPGQRSTPVNLSGDLCYAILSLGELGPGMFGMTWLAPENTFPNGPHSGTCSTVKFNLSNPVTISSHIVVPETADDMPASQMIIRAELSFNYVDATFQVNGTSPEYTIRTVYASSATAPDVDGTMYRGDKLIRLPGETLFRWASASGTTTVRDAADSGIYTDVTVTDYQFPGQGNPDYVPVTANFHEALPVTWQLITDPTQLWTLEFDLSDAIVWAEDPALFTTPEQYVAAFRLKFGPNQTTTMGEEDDGIRAQLRIETATQK